MNSKVRTLTCTVALLLLAPLAFADGDILTPEMLVDLAAVSEVALAPDGGSVAYTLTAPRAADDEPGSSYKQLWLAATGSGEPRRFTAGKERVGAPAFSPDGKLVTFLVERKPQHEGTQIWAIPADGGEASALTSHDGSVASYRWSPDGRHIAYAATDAEPEDEKKAKEAGKDWEVEGEDLSFRHLWIHDMATEKSRRLLDADLDVSLIRWTPDGGTLVFQANTTARTDDEYMRTGIYTLAVGEAGALAEGEEAAAPARLTPTPGKLGPMAVSPDGARLAWLGAVSVNDPLAQSLFVAPLAGGEARNLTPGYEGSAADLAWPDDGGAAGTGILLLAVEGERHALYRVDAATGERRAVDALSRPGLERPDSPLIVHAMDAAAGRTAFAADSPRHPAALFVAGEDGQTRRVGDPNPELAGVRLARQEATRWEGADGWTIGGVLTYPLDYEEGQRYPLVLQVHGGPEGVSLDGWTTSPLYPVQLLAARGYMVLQPNYRGSQGLGVAFSKADHDDLGGKEFDDVLAGVDALIERGLVDPERVGTGGWSYGGYMSAWAATRWSERFAASVVAAGLTNWISFAGTTDIPYEMSLVHWDSWWFDEPELHWRRSPMAYLNQARTPTLVVTGAADERVHPEQARQLYTGLRIKGVPTQMVFYPREPHGLRERAHQLDFIGRTLGWFDQHLGVPAVEGVEERRD